MSGEDRPVKQRLREFFHVPANRRIPNGERFALGVISVLVIAPSLLAGPMVLFIALMYGVIYLGPTVILLKSSGLHGVMRWIFCFTAVPLFIVLFVYFIDWFAGKTPRLVEGAAAGGKSSAGAGFLMAFPAAVVMIVWYLVARWIDKALRHHFGRSDADHETTRGASK